MRHVLCALRIAALPSLSLIVAPTAVCARETSVRATAPDFGPNVILLDPSMPVDRINETLQRVEKGSDPWTKTRTAIYLLPGTYGKPAAKNAQKAASGYINSVVGPMTSIQGLGAAPGDVVVNGNLRIIGNLGTFWRSLQNMRINPIDPESPGALRWIVSEASPLRRIDISGDLDLGVGHVAFGAAIGNTRVSGVVNSGNGRAKGVPGAGGQAHYYAQDSAFKGGWIGQSVNFVFSGVQGAPPTDFGPRAGKDGPGDKTTLGTTPVSRDAPFLFVDRGRYNVFVPKARMNARGIAWGLGNSNGDVQPINAYFIAKPTDNAATINAALAGGKNLLLTPGVYELDAPIDVTRPGTVVLGMGYATLQPVRGTPALRIGDVPGVVVSSLVVDAGLQNSDVLIEVGPNGGQPWVRGQSDVLGRRLCSRRNGHFGQGDYQCRNQPEPRAHQSYMDLARGPFSRRERLGNECRRRRAGGQWRQRHRSRRVCRALPQATGALERRRRPDDLFPIRASP